MKDNVKHRITVHNDPIDYPEYCRANVREERPLRRAVHVGEAIRTRTLGTSNSKLLLHGIYDTEDSQDFGEPNEIEPKDKPKDKPDE